MGYNRRGVRDGSGPYKGSFQRRHYGSRGRRILRGERCPQRGKK